MIIIIMHVAMIIINQPINHNQGRHGARAGVVGGAEEGEVLQMEEMVCCTTGGEDDDQFSLR